eukprot:snap_masked-scaffold_6-processed-gene-19.35-mRNA-1 protein AED:1.00 eAED:1.00 QI:0/-1/0/0/-1/1/1/0/253
MEEEQRLELEALESIYGEEFQLISTEIPLKFKILFEDIEEESTSEDRPLISIIFTFPENYPETAPEVEIDEIKQFQEDAHNLIEKFILQSCDELIGTPMIYSVIDVLKEYIEENKDTLLLTELQKQAEKDGSMHLKMLAEKEKQRALENQKKETKVSEAELEEREKKRRENIELVTKDIFQAWNENFLKEMQKDKVEQNIKQTGKAYFMENDKSLDLNIAAGEEVLQNLENIQISEEDLYLEEEDLSGFSDED